MERPIAYDKLARDDRFVRMLVNVSEGVNELTDPDGPLTQRHDRGDVKKAAEREKS